MRELSLPDLDSYLERLRSDPAELAGLPDLMLVTVSRFFRNVECWRDLSEKILPVLIAEKGNSGIIRAWSAGCCSGEEPYTLALVWLEWVSPIHTGLSMDIMATDIDPASLQRAHSALYERGSIREVPPEITGRWFSHKGNQWRLNDEARRLVKFERRNMMSDPPPGIMDLVICRYLAFTYYRGHRLDHAVTRLLDAVRPGGFLMIGKKERLPPGALETFEKINGCAGLYRKKTGPVHFPVSNSEG